MTKRAHISLHLLLVPMLFLAGCWPKEQAKHEAQPIEKEGAAAVGNMEDGSPVLMKIDGRPVITLKSIDEEFDRLLEENPNLKQVLPFMPDAKLNFFQGMVSQEIVDHYVHVNHLDTTPEYQKEFEKTMEQVKRMLNTKYFSDRHPVTVSDSEVRKFYEENKDKIPDLMESQGGVKAEAVSFAKEEDAKAFLAKAKESKEGLEKVATEAGYAEHYHDFKLVNNQSVQVEPALRSKIVALNRFPVTELYQIGDSWWVVQAHSKTEPHYVPFDKIKVNLEEYLKKQKQMETFEKTIDTYKKEYGVEINDEPLQVKHNEAAKTALLEARDTSMEVAQYNGSSDESHTVEAPARIV